MLGVFTHLGFNRPGLAPVDYEELAVTNGGVVVLTAAKVRAAEFAEVLVIGGNVRVTVVQGQVPVTGTAPLAGFGMTIFGGSNFTLNKGLMLYFSAIAQDANAAQLQVLYTTVNR